MYFTPNVVCSPLCSTVLFFLKESLWGALVPVFILVGRYHTHVRPPRCVTYEEMEDSSVVICSVDLGKAKGRHCPCVPSLSLQLRL